MPRPPYMLAILAPGNCRQEGQRFKLIKLEASLGYMRPIQKQKIKNKTRK